MNVQIIQKIIWQQNRRAYSLWIFNVTVWAFNNIENMHTLYLGEDCMKNFCEKRKRGKHNWFWSETNVTVEKRKTKITSTSKNMLQLWKKNLKKLSKRINHRKVIYNYTDKYRGAAHSISNLKFDMLNEIPVVFHNGSILF